MNPSSKQQPFQTPVKAFLSSKPFELPGSLFIFFSKKKTTKTQPNQPKPNEPTKISKKTNQNLIKTKPEPTQNNFSDTWEPNDLPGTRGDLRRLRRHRHRGEPKNGESCRAEKGPKAFFLGFVFFFQKYSFIIIFIFLFFKKYYNIYIYHNMALGQGYREELAECPLPSLVQVQQKRLLVKEKID